MFVRHRKQKPGYYPSNFSLNTKKGVVQKSGQPPFHSITTLLCHGVGTQSTQHCRCYGNDNFQNHIPIKLFHCFSFFCWRSNLEAAAPVIHLKLYSHLLRLRKRTRRAIIFSGKQNGIINNTCKEYPRLSNHIQRKKLIIPLALLRELYALTRLVPPLPHPLPHLAYLPDSAEEYKPVRLPNPTISVAHSPLLPSYCIIHADTLFVSCLIHICRWKGIIRKKFLIPDDSDRVKQWDLSAYRHQHHYFLHSKQQPHL